MKKFYLIALIIAAAFATRAAGITLDPTITPALFGPTTQITVVYDVTGTSLASLTEAWAWVWIPATSISAKYNINPATSGADNAKFTKSVVGGRTLFTIVFKPSDFFAADISAQTRMGILLKGKDWANGQTSDHFSDFASGGFEIKLTSPTERPLFVNTGEVIQIKAESTEPATFELYINTVLADTKTGITNYTYSHTVTETTGSGSVRIVGKKDTNTSEAVFQYVISGNSPQQARPSGIISGINYKASDHTKVTLCLLAPDKTSAYVIGDFSNWEVQPQNIMKRDGEYFWIELSGLTPGQEYAFQYLVDESLYLADPYADKILDTDDQYIPASSYPNLKAFPEKARHNEWYFNRLAVFQTNKPAYTWQVPAFEKPAKEKLVVYELLIRDFFANGQRNYQNLIDTISYFKRLGVNAIELMPIMEFNGNESWGYNPAFMFAPDKYYGTRDKLREFVDVCHQNGIAVILDIAMNHQDLPNPYVMMAFNFTSMKPTGSNRWFNTDAKHPFNVFYDMNHESSYTKHYLDTVNYHWLHDYNVDGFRFDLSKGFTQTNNPGNEPAWSAYDASRITILKRMADKIWEHTPDAYIILEHLSVNTEEKELAEYRANEGKGMMLWGKMTEPYNQATMGYAENSSISNVLYSNRGWSTPHLVSYMESHDEERLMVKNIDFGNASGAYNVKNLSIGLSRIKTANAVFYTIPGPKMLWQFGELGYDFAINYCEDGTENSDCRVSPKPLHWDYRDDSRRYDIYRHAAELIKLRNTYSVFTEGTATVTSGAITAKQVQLKNVPYTETPANTDQMNVQVVANFDVKLQNIPVEFPHTGTWYEFYSGESVQVGTLPFSVSFKAGEAKLYTDVTIGTSLVTGVTEEETLSLTLYPNPVDNVLYLEQESTGRIHDVRAYTNQGIPLSLPRISETSWDVSRLAHGLYVIEVRSDNRILRKKIIKR